MGFRGSRVQIPPSRLSEDQALQPLRLWGFFFVAPRAVSNAVSFYRLTIRCVGCNTTFLIVSASACWYEVVSTAARYGLSPAEIANPRLVKPWWPHPGRMLKDKRTSSDRLARMQFLNDWYYGQLSAESHLSLPGLVMRSTALIPGHDPDELEWRMDKVRSDNFLIATFMVLAFASEIEIECRFGLSDRLKYVWTVLAGYAKGAQTLYDKW